MCSAADDPTMHDSDAPTPQEVADYLARMERSKAQGWGVPDKCPICHNPTWEHEEGHPFHPEPCPVCEAERAPGMHDSGAAFQDGYHEALRDVREGKEGARRAVDWPAAPPLEPQGLGGWSPSRRDPDRASAEGLREAIEQALAEPGVRGHGRRVLALALEAYALRDHSDSGDIDVERWLVPPHDKYGNPGAPGDRRGTDQPARAVRPPAPPLTGPTLSDIDDLKARLRGQIPDMSPPSRMRWKVDDPTAQYDPLVRLSAVYQVIDEWATPDRAGDPYNTIDPIDGGRNDR